MVQWVARRVEQTDVLDEGERPEGLLDSGSVDNDQDRHPLRRETLLEHALSLSVSAMRSSVQPQCLLVPEG